jgi:hypothetical protein
MGKYLVFGSIGFELVGLVLGCYYLGQFLDERYQTKGLIFVFLTFFALIAWLVRVVWMLKRFQKEDESNSEDDKNT